MGRGGGGGSLEGRADTVHYPQRWMWAVGFRILLVLSEHDDGVEEYKDGVVALAKVACGCQDLQPDPWIFHCPLSETQRLVHIESPSSGTHTLPNYQLLKPGLLAPFWQSSADLTMRMSSSMDQDRDSSHGGHWILGKQGQGVAPPGWGWGWNGIGVGVIMPNTRSSPLSLVMEGQ